MSNLYLIHHGIPGQKWGVRRYQNSDGTLTAEGKSRYRINKSAELEYIKRRGDVSDQEAKKYLKRANDIYNHAKAIEPQISKDVSNAILNSGSKLNGFQNRLKTRKSIGAKLSSDKDTNVKDAIRYTSITDDSNFVDGYFKTKKQLESKGYKEIKCKNYFEMYKNGQVKHKSVQCNYMTKEGDIFEIQFQTHASQKAKDLKVPIYEESRNKTTSSKRRKQLEKKMIELAESVPYPNDISRIKSH